MYFKPLNKLTKAFPATTKNKFTRVERRRIRDKLSPKTMIKYYCKLPQI